MKTSNACNTIPSRPLRGALAALVGAILMSGAAVAATPTYRIVLLPELPDTGHSAAYAISDAGQIVGSASDLASGTYAISWGTAPYAPQPLASLAPHTTVAWAVNDAGVVVGNAGLDFGSLAVLWDPSGAIVELGDLPRGPLQSSANDINGSGVAVGQGTSTQGRVGPVFWTMPGQTRKLGPALYSGLAEAVNDFGDVAGYYTSGRPAFVTHAARWRVGRQWMQDLGDLPGGSDFSKAYGINDARQVVGTSQSDLGARAVLWSSDGSMTDLGDLGDGSSYVALDINEAGNIVGRYETSVTRRGFLWTATDGMRDLYDLIDPADPLRAQFGADFVNIEAINASGLIVGTMYPDPEDLNPHAIVLVPQE